MKKLQQKFVITLLSLGLAIVILSWIKPVETLVNTTWKAPASANKLKNSVKGNATATAAGKKIYTQMCAICHGNKGKGDGMAGMSLNPRPTNFTTNKVQSQTDGAIYWKITEGRAPMASYKTALKSNQRWQLVNYIRTFKKNKPKPKTITKPTEPIETPEEKKKRLKKELTQKFNQLIKEGDLSLNNKKLNEAKLKYSKAINLRPTDSTTIFKLNKLEILLVEKEKRDILKKEIKEELKVELKKELIQEIIKELRDTLK